MRHEQQTMKENKNKHKEAIETSYNINNTARWFNMKI